MSKNFIEAALLQLRGKGIEHLAAIENMVTHPVGVADHTGHVGDIIDHARKAAECEEAVKLLQKYFISKPAAPPRPPPRPGGPVLPSQSPTMRKAMAVQPPTPSKED